MRHTHLLAALGWGASLMWYSPQSHCYHGNCWLAWKRGEGGGILVDCKFIGGELSWCFWDALQIRTRLKGLELFLKIQSLSEWDAWHTEKGEKHAFHRNVDPINGWEMWIEASCMKWMNGWLILISHLVPVVAQQPIKGLTETNKVTVSIARPG